MKSDHQEPQLPVIDPNPSFFKVLRNIPIKQTLSPPLFCGSVSVMAYHLKTGPKKPSDLTSLLLSALPLVSYLYVLNYAISRDQLKGISRQTQEEVLASRKKQFPHPS
ncbi:hypothetical protein M5689_009857 [Euphorbia peplus]|nr:hypothetical protein M5689_009857 [Euphorbia peplus]